MTPLDRHHRPGVEFTTSTGASLTAVTLTVFVAGLLIPPTPSVNTMRTVRAAVDGASGHVGVGDAAHQGLYRNSIGVGVRAHHQRRRTIGAAAVKFR